MPFYYDLNNALTSNGSGGTETDHLRLLTVANQTPCRIMSIYGASRFATAGGAILRLKTYGTASTAGSAQTPAKRNPNSPAASTTAFTGPTAGTTITIRQSIGIAQTGGTGGWFALEPDHAVTLLPNGGATGNADLVSIANAASVTFDATLEFVE